MSKQITITTEAAIFAALAMALSFIPDFASWFTPSFGAIPLILFSLRRGTKYGLLAGLTWGLLHFVLSKVYYLSFSQVLIEYIFAFISMGLAGVVSTSLQKAIQEKCFSRAYLLASAGALFAVLVRYLWHFAAGVIFWSSYAPKGMSAFLYSLSINGIAGALTALFVLISLWTLLATQAQFFLAKRK